MNRGRLARALLLALILSGATPGLVEADMAEARTDKRGQEARCLLAWLLFVAR